jgi:hypothetical protein
MDSGKKSLLSQSYFSLLIFSKASLLISSDFHNNLFNSLCPIFIMFIILFLIIFPFPNIQSADLFIVYLSDFNQCFDFINKSGQVNLLNFLKIISNYN